MTFKLLILFFRVDLYKTPSIRAFKLQNIIRTAKKLKQKFPHTMYSEIIEIQKA